MYELIKVTDNCFYIESPAKIGIVKTEDRKVVLIDSGSDKDAGKKALKILNENGWELEAIYNTHSHADHIGGNAYLSRQTGCKIYAPSIEDAFTSSPILEPAFLYGGNPPKDLKHKFLMAEECSPLPLTEDVLPENLKLISLKGHSFNMVGFRTDENIVFLADALSSEATLQKYGIGFNYDIEEYLKTLEEIKNMSAALFIPSHSDAVKDIAPLAQYNIEKVEEVSNKILDICKTPIIFEELLKKIFAEYSLNMSFQQYALIGSTLRSYLTYLKNQEKIKVEIKDNLLLWQTI